MQEAFVLFPQAGKRGSRRVLCKGRLVPERREVLVPVAIPMLILSASAQYLNKRSAVSAC